MTAQGHLLFSITCSLLAHKLQLTTGLVNSSIWQTIPIGLVGALLPDLDHPKSTLGQRMRWISLPLSALFGHRGFTHSLLAVALAIWGLQQSIIPSWLPVGVKDALIIGYLSHLLGDWLTPAGIPLFWPIRRRYRLPGWPLKSGGSIEFVFCVFSLLIVGWWSR